MLTRKCLLVGDGGTGKTSLMKRLMTGEFSAEYSATVGYEVHRLTIGSAKSSAPRFALHVWDVSGQSTSGSLLREILSSSHCAIILFDITSRITMNNAWIWYRDIVDVCGPEIPMVILGNKIDMPGRKMKMGSLPKRFPIGVKYYEVSVKMRENIEEPILWLAGQLLKGSQSDVMIEPPRVTTDPEISNGEWVDKNEETNESQGVVQGNMKRKLREKRGLPSGRKLRNGSNNSDVKI